MDTCVTESALKKRCTKCRELKSVDLFYKHKSSPDGHAWYCKVCSGAQTKTSTAARPRNMSARACIVCGIVKDGDQFPKHHNSCKACESIADKTRHTANYEAHLAYSRAYEASHREERKAYGKTQASKDIHRRKHLKTKYGIGPSDFEKLIELQNGKCKCCSSELKGRWHEDTAPVVDHCHNAGHVRGIICNRCNKAEGMLGTPQTVLALYHYMLQNELFYGGKN